MAPSRSNLPREVPILDDDDIDNAVVLPTQFFPSLKGRRPEHKLLWALILSAVYSIMGKQATTKEEWAADWNWINTTDDTEWSFNWCCGHLDLNGPAIRQACLRRQRRKPK